MALLKDSETSASRQLQPLKNSPPASRNLSVLMLVVSLSLHGLFLLIPISSERKSKPSPPEKKIKITQLPSTLKSPVAKASLKASLSPKQVQPMPQPVARSQIVIPSRSRTKPKQTPQPNPSASFTPQPEFKQTPQAHSTLTSSPSVSSANPWDDFPRYPNAQPGCFELPSCFQTRKNLSEVVAYFEKELPKQYEAKLTIKEDHRKVYQVSTKNGMTQYLSLILAPEKGTVYVLAPEPRKLEDFKNAVEVPPEFTNILSGLVSQDGGSSNFAQPSLFYPNPGTEVPRSEISSIKLVPDEPAETILDSLLKTNLQNNGFEISDMHKQFGGGTVYEVKKDKLKLYLNLVPTQDNKGTLVVVWKSSPF